MFIRVLKLKEQKELLINTNLIWKIEVSYAIPPATGDQAWQTTLKEGLTNPNAVRFYEIYVGSEKVRLFSNPGDPVLKVVEDIYNKAIKAEEPKDGHTTKEEP